MHTHSGERESHVRNSTIVNNAAIRVRMEAAIESMIALLDEMEGDSDVEPNGDEMDNPGDRDEPSLGWTGTGTGWRSVASDGAQTPLEVDLEGDDVDAEETALERHGEGFLFSGGDDSEEHDDGGGDINDEPQDEMDERAADDDALHLLVEEEALTARLRATEHERFAAHDATRVALRLVTGRRPLNPSHWPDWR